MSTCLGTKAAPRSITRVEAARTGTTARRGRATQDPMASTRSRRRQGYVSMRAELSTTPGWVGRQSARERERTGLTAGGAGDAPDRHVAPVAGHGPVFFRLAAPEAVLPVLPGPRLAGLQ